MKIQEDLNVTRFIFFIKSVSQIYCLTSTYNMFLLLSYKQGVMWDVILFLSKERSGVFFARSSQVCFSMQWCGMKVGSFLKAKEQGEEEWEQEDKRDFWEYDAWKLDK